MSDITKQHSPCANIHITHGKKLHIPHWKICPFKDKSHSGVADLSLTGGVQAAELTPMPPEKSLQWANRVHAIPMRQSPMILTHTHSYY